MVFWYSLYFYLEIWYILQKWSNLPFLCYLFFANLFLFFIKRLLDLDMRLGPATSHRVLYNVLNCIFTNDKLTASLSAVNQI